MHPSLTITDITPPSLTCDTGNCCTNITVQVVNLASTVVNWNEPLFADYTHLTSTHNYSSEFPITLPGTTPTEVRITAYDDAGNKALCRFFVTVSDVAPPTATCPTPQVYTLNDTATDGRVIVPPSALIPPSMQDNSGEALFEDISQLFPNGFPINTTTISQHVYDRSNNSITCRYTVTVLDFSPPRLIRPCENQIYAVTGKSRGEVIHLNISVPAASDNSGYFSESVESYSPLASVNLTSNVGSSNLRDLQLQLSSSSDMTVYSFRYSATDASSLTQSCNFTVSVQNSISGSGGSGSGSDSSSSSSGASSSSSSSALLPIIIGAVVGGVILLAILLVFIYIRKSRRKRVPHDFAGLLDQIYGAESGNMIKPREINRDFVKIISNLGKGNFGTVDKGLLHERNLGIPEYLVAIKQLQSKRNEDRVTLLEEAATMAQFSHKHLVALIGVVTIGDPMMVLLEYCEHGSLDSYLKKNDLAENIKILIAGDCAEGECVCACVCVLCVCVCVVFCLVCYMCACCKNVCM